MIIDKINKLTLPATILITSIILGGFIFATQIAKQQSIERQQEIKLEEERQQQEIKIEQEKQEAKAKAEQDHKKYVAKRKMECYEIYEKERKQYNNVESYEYIETCINVPDDIDIEDIPNRFLFCQDDSCEILYKNIKTGKYFTKSY